MPSRSITIHRLEIYMGSYKTHCIRYAIAKKANWYIASA